MRAVENSYSKQVRGIAVRWFAWRKLWREHRTWVIEDVLAPVAITRVALLIVAWFSSSFPRNPVYPIQEATARGWHFSPHRLLDVWGRWDTGWYFSIIQDGYYLNGDVQSAQSNVAFFPLYPLLVKGFLLFVPDAWETSGFILLIGVLLSNLFLVVALLLLHRLVMFHFGDRVYARRAIVYLLVYPTGYFYSSFYTESLFLLLSVSAFLAALYGRWRIAGACGFLLGLTRPLGILILIPLLWMYMSQRDWQIRRINGQILGLLLIPAGMVAFLFYIGERTGFFWAPLEIQAAWNRQLMPPWVALLSPEPVTAGVTLVAQVLSVIFVLVSLGLFFPYRLHAYGIYSLLMLAPTLVHGTLMSNSRYYMTIFPVFVLIAAMIRWKFVGHLVITVFFVLQLLYMMSWSQFFWVE